MKSSDWIVACDGSNPALPFGFKCNRCGQHEPVSQPIPLDVYQYWAERFTERHKGCKPQAEEESNGA